MEFKHLKNVELNELQLLHEVTQYIQSRFEKYQCSYFYLSLDTTGFNKSKIEYEKVYLNIDDLMDHYYGSKYLPAVFLIKFIEGKYIIQLFGYNMNATLRVFAKKISFDRIYNTERIKNCIEMAPRKLIEESFKELKQMFLPTNSESK